jgi:hypothetical protein
MYNGSQWVPTSITHGGGGGGGGGGSVDASAIASVGGILDSQFSGLGYVRKTGTQAFVASSTLPASNITGLGVLATTSTQASAISFLNLGQLAQVSTATSGRTFLGFTAYGATLVSAANAAAAGTLLNLGTLATTSTAASARSFISQSLSTLTDVSAGTPSTNTFLRYNGTQWAPASVATGGSLALGDLTNVSVPSPTNNQALVFDTSKSQWVATSITSGSAVVSLGSVQGFGTVGLTLASAATTNGALTALGFSSLSQTLVSAPTADIYRGVLGFSTFGGQIVSAGTATSVNSLLGLGTLATTSTAASARTFIGATTFGSAMITAATTNAGQTVLGMSAFGTSLVSSANAAAAGTLLNLGTLATTSTAASARSFIGQTLANLPDTSVVSPGTNTFLRYNGTQWAPASVAAGGGSPTFAGSFFTLDPGNPAITNATVTLRAAVSVVNTSNAYSTVDGRFTPGVAGYYECNMRVRHTCVTSVSRIITFDFWKNGTSPVSPYDFFPVQVLTAPVAGQADTVNVQNTFFLNGSTDFVVPVAGGIDNVSKSVSMGYVYFRYLGA